LKKIDHFKRFTDIGLMHIKYKAKYDNDKYCDLNLSFEQLKI